MNRVIRGLWATWAILGDQQPRHTSAAYERRAHTQGTESCLWGYGGRFKF